MALDTGLPEGYNPMKWDCAKQGCFNVLRRPKIEVFADCFPRRASLGDVDGWLELGRKFLMLEWKGKGGSLTRGQSLAYERFTDIPGNIVFVVEGDAQTMVVDRYSTFWDGEFFPSKSAALSDLKKEMQAWAWHVEEG